MAERSVGIEEDFRLVPNEHKSYARAITTMANQSTQSYLTETGRMDIGERGGAMGLWKRMEEEEEKEEK